MDPRLVDVVRYRLSRKESHSAAVGILEEFLTPEPPASPAPATINPDGGGEEEKEEEEEDKEEDHITKGDGE